MPLLGALVLLLVVLLAGRRHRAHPGDRHLDRRGPDRKRRDRPVRRRGDRGAAVHHPDRLRDHLPGAEGHRVHEPADRSQPHRPWGTLASVVHGLKVLSKEDFTPDRRRRHRLHARPRRDVRRRASWRFLVMPFGPGLFGLRHEHRPAVLLRRSAASAWSGLLMAGWSSFNKYSLLGGLRSAAQMVSYEIPLTLSVVGVIMLAGTMSLNGIVRGPVGELPRLVRRPPAARVPDLLHRRHGRGEPHAVRPDRGRQRDRRPASRPSTAACASASSSSRST